MKSSRLVISILFILFSPHSKSSQGSLGATPQLPSVEELMSSPHHSFQYTCGIENQFGGQFKYCIRNVDRSKNHDIVYFLHGLDGNERTWFEQKLGTALIEKIWNHWGYNPTIVTVSFGNAWLLVDNEKIKSLPYFQQVVMPVLEQKVGGLKNGRRLLIGESMGGFNAAELALQYGAFSKIALLCPALTIIGPYSSNNQIQNYIDRTNADSEKVKLMLSIARQAFVGPQDWNKHDPFRLLTKFKSAKVRPQFYISTGVADDYGFQEGTARFTQISHQAGINTWWVPAPGFHCDFDRPTTARFFMEGL